jgi:septal ring factor EnvC (AmiA/AmiB activator)
MTRKSQRHRLAADIATASTLDTRPARFVKPTESNMLIDIAKRLQRLQTRGAKLRKELKRNDTDIRHVKRELRALSQQLTRGDDLEGGTHA